MIFAEHVIKRNAILYESYHENCSANLDVLILHLHYNKSHFTISETQYSTPLSESRCLKYKKAKILITSVYFFLGSWMVWLALRDG